MDINDLTIKQARELAGIFSPSNTTEHPFAIGKNYSLRLQETVSAGFGNNTMKNIKRIGRLGFLVASLVLSGCATDWSAVGTSVIDDVQSGTVLATEAYAAYSAVNQQLTAANVTTGKLDPAKVLAAAAAINNGLQTPGLATAVLSFVGDANTTIKNLQGATPAAIATAVSTQGAGTVTTIAAITPVSS